MKIISSNRMEFLTGALAEIVKVPLPSPLEKEVIVTQSKGMERWISLELARLLGICANVEFSLPRRMVERVFREALGDPSPEDSPYAPGPLAWEIMGILPSIIGRKGFESLTDYLRTDDPGKRFQLSRLVADSFDQYAVYRPEMVLDWEKGKGKDWQARLWREVAREKTEPHFASLWGSLALKARDPAVRVEGLPTRISVFGVSALPPAYLDVLAAASRWSRVTFFVLNPCGEYWADIVSTREITRITGKEKAADISRESLHLTEGNSLLSSMGPYGRDFFTMLQHLEAEETKRFFEPEPDTLLADIQRDILNLNERGDDGKKSAVDPGDDSIQVHSCHGILRELEALRDSLLDMFQRDPDLTPGDVLVMTPKIEEAAPYAQAVFGTASSDDQRIPYTISDQNLRKTNRTAESFLALLGLPASRFRALETLALLESPPIRRGFGFSEQDMETVKRWAQGTRIRWGIDGKFKEEAGLSGFTENTWQAGMESLFLGYAMEADSAQGDPLFQGILPYPDLMEGQADLLGRLQEFIEQLFDCFRSLKEDRTLTRWAEFLEGIIKTFFSHDEEGEAELGSLHDALSDLKRDQKRSGFSGKVGWRVVRAWFKHRLERHISSRGFITGKVTFCAMLPMRSIPFKVICLIGMNGRAYPRAPVARGFDLIAKRPRRGDRSLGKEDRQIFLEALISVRKRLYISYSGRSVKDNHASPPSTLVSELLDYIDKGFKISGSDDPPSGSLIREHKLHAFNPAYFQEGSPLFSFSREEFEASLALEGNDCEPVPFISRGLSDPQEELRRVTPERLRRFFDNPAEFLLRQRLWMRLEQRGFNLRDKEPFRLEGLDRYAMLNDLVARGLSGRGVEGAYPMIKASGVLPHGVAGVQEFRALREQAEWFVSLVMEKGRGRVAEPIEIDIRLKDFMIVGPLANVASNGIFLYRPGNIRARDRLKVWIGHLILNAAAPEGVDKTSLFVGTDRILRLSPVKNAEGLLNTLLNWYWEGLTRPLHFFPASSYAFAKEIYKGNKSANEALARAFKEWKGNEHRAYRSEFDDPYFRLCFKDMDPFDAVFQSVALDLFELSFEHTEEEIVAAN